ncbi:MAG: family 43 glycosylhydrolase [Fimbriimonadaceae bacterium]|nr:family 43 glycosylhydrolase [Fimbriimonadaceae bacterium]
MRFTDSRSGVPFAKDPAVVQFGGVWWLYYSTRLPNGRLVMGIARGTDGDQWEQVGELLPAAEHEANGLCAPGAVVREGRVHLFYQTYGNGPRDAICHAVSADGLRFERDASNPIFRPTGAWNNGRAIDADVIAWRDRWWLHFSSRDPSGQIQLGGVASAPLAADFSRDCWTQAKDAPTLRPELPWERRCIEAPALCVHDDRLFLFYAGAYNNEPQQIGCAVSDDGLSFTRLSDQPLLANGPAGSWNESESGHPFVMTEDTGRTWLYFQGNCTKGRDWYLSRVELVWRDGRPQLASDQGLNAGGAKLRAAGEP